MSAANTDLFKKLSRRWVGQIGAGGVADNTTTTVPLASSTNLPTGTAVVVVIDRVSANGTATANLEESLIGVVSGTNLVSCIRGAEGTAQAHNAGAVVEVLFTAKGWNDLVDGLLVEHGQNGKHTLLNGNSIASGSDAVALLGTAQSWTATQTEKQTVFTNNAITASSNAATVPVTSRLNTVTNDSAGNMTITMTTTSAVDGQFSVVRVYDFSGVTKTITWVNTENSGISAPTTSNGSTTLPITAGFQYNSATSKWRCIANA